MGRGDVNGCDNEDWDTAAVGSGKPRSGPRTRAEVSAKHEDNYIKHDVIPFLIGDIRNLAWKQPH